MPAFRFSLSLITAFIAISTMAPAQDWQMVDDFTVGSATAEAHGVAVDSSGGIYVAGTANGHAIVRYSGDGGSTWSTRDDFLYPSQTDGNLNNAIIIDRQGNFFVGGASGNHWIVRRSTDRGATWNIVDDYYRPMIDPLHPGTNGVVYSLSSDTQGRVYGAGLMRITGPTYLKWWVRGSDIGGTNWDTKLVLDSGYAGVSQLTCAGEDVYVTGQTSDSEVATGLILGSSDHGTTWATNFQSTNEFYPALTSDLAGNAYSAGTISTNADPSYSYAWRLRKGIPGSPTWTALDQFSSSGSPQSVTVGAAGNICVAGHSASNYIVGTTNGYTSYAIWNWLTRQYSVASGQWRTTDVFSYGTNLNYMLTTATGAAIAPDGSTFVVGWGTSNSGQRHWLVRKRAGPHRLQITLGGAGVTVSWPASYTNSTLEWTDCADLHQPWHGCTNTVNVVQGCNTATFDLASGARFFRLTAPAAP